MDNDYELILQRVYRLEKGIRSYLRIEVLSKEEKILAYFQEVETSDIHRALDFILGYNPGEDTLYKYRDVVQMSSKDAKILEAKAEQFKLMLEEIRRYEDKDRRHIETLLNMKDSGYVKL